MPIYTVFTYYWIYGLRLIVYYMLPHTFKICGFKNSIVYMFYVMYQKYTCFVKLYICGLTYRLYGQYRHKLRIDVITYIPTLANGIPTLSGQQQDIRSTAVVVGRSTTSLWWWIPRGFVDAGTGVSQRGRLQFLKMSFLRIIRLLMIFASIQKIWHQNKVSDKLDHTS